MTMTRPASDDQSRVQWGQRTSIMEVILSLIIRKGIMILSHKNDEQFKGEGALKDLVSL